MSSQRSKYSVPISLISCILGSGDGLNVFLVAFPLEWRVCHATPCAVEYPTRASITCSGIEDKEKVSRTGVPARPNVSSRAKNGTKGVGLLPGQAKQASRKMLHARSVLFVERIDHSVVAIVGCLQY